MGGISAKNAGDRRPWVLCGGQDASQDAPVVYSCGAIAPFASESSPTRYAEVSYFHHSP